MTVTSTGNITTAGSRVRDCRHRHWHGAVTVTSTGNITTAGNSRSGFMPSNGNAGAVTVTSTGNITTAGNYAFGIFAVNDGAGAVTVTSTGNITTAGSNAHGIFAGAWRRRGDGDLDRQYHHRGRPRVRDFCRQHGWRRDGDLDRQHHHLGQRTRSGLVPARALARSTVTSTGNITTAGANAYGIFAAAWRWRCRR